jgi:hypothetical protein
MSKIVRYIPAFHKFDICENTASNDDPAHSNCPPSLDTENDISVSSSGIFFNFRNCKKLGYVTGFITYNSMVAPGGGYNETGVHVYGIVVRELNGVSVTAEIITGFKKMNFMV